MMDYVLKNSNGKAVLINGKCVMFKVDFDKFTNRMAIARQIFREYPKSFSTVSEVIETLRAYEKTGNFIIKEHCAYILHQA